MGLAYFNVSRRLGTVVIPHLHCGQRAFWLLFFGRCAANVSRATKP